jgi:hypothetical protein
MRDLDEGSTESNKDDAITAGDDDAQRMRSFLKRTILLTKEAQEEIAKRTEYLRMLKRHYEGVANLRKLMRGVELDAWFWMCDRWRTLGRKYYEPLSESKCDKVVQETLEAIKKHKVPEGTKEGGEFGWRDWVHLDADGHYVRFVTRKTLWNVDMEQVVDHTWSIYSDSELFKKNHLRENCKLFHHTLQQISPDVMVVQRVEKYPTLVQLTHSLALTFRVRTETGYMIVTRCIESPRLQSLMKAEGLSLCESFLWDTFDVAHRDGQGECDAIHFTVAGSAGSDNPTYARRARDEILIALVRYEIQLIDSSILPIESSSEEATAVLNDSQS